ncbi:DUF3973 domain-containing protein [Paenibacillus alvei]|nr:DUF3973 domain-containing protein [Paenibacillus alvei]
MYYCLKCSQVHYDDGASATVVFRNVFYVDEITKRKFQLGECHLKSPFPCPAGSKYQQVFVPPRETVLQMLHE